jgi:hypothetical protein
MELLQPLNDPTFTARTASYTGTAGSTGTWPAGPQGVVIWSTTAAYVVIGEGVTATTADTPIPANTPIPFVVPANVSGPWRVSAIQITSNGTLYVKPINIR